MDYLTGLYEGAKQTAQGIAEAGEGVGQMVKNSYQVGQGAYKAGSGLSKAFGGAALPVLGTVALLAAKGLGAGPLVELGASGLAHAIKFGAQGIGWLGKKIFARKKEPHRLRRYSRIKRKPLAVKQIKITQQPDDILKTKYIEKQSMPEPIQEEVEAIQEE